MAKVSRAGWIYRLAKMKKDTGGVRERIMWDVMTQNTGIGRWGMWGLLVRIDHRIFPKDKKFQWEMGGGVAEMDSLTAAKNSHKPRVESRGGRKGD